MGLKDMLITGGSPLSCGNGTTPTTNPGATQQSKLHADGNVASYSVNGANASIVNSAYVAYNDGYNNSLPQPSQLDLQGIIPSKYLDNPPQ
jgi:hypothetical protein